MDARAQMSFSVLMAPVKQLLVQSGSNAQMIKFSVQLANVLQMIKLVQVLQQVAQLIDRFIVHIKDASKPELLVKTRRQPGLILMLTAGQVV